MSRIGLFAPISDRSHKDIPIKLSRFILEIERVGITNSVGVGFSRESIYNRKHTFSKRKFFQINVFRAGSYQQNVVRYHLQQLSVYAMGPTELKPTGDKSNRVRQ